MTKTPRWALHHFFCETRWTHAGCVDVYKRMSIGIWTHSTHFKSQNSVARGSFGQTPSVKRLCAMGCDGYSGLSSAATLFSRFCWLGLWGDARSHPTMANNARGSRQQSHRCIYLWVLGANRGKISSFNQGGFGSPGILAARTASANTPLKNAPAFACSTKPCGFLKQRPVNVQIARVKKCRRLCVKNSPLRKRRATVF